MQLLLVSTARIDFSRATVRKNGSSGISDIEIVVIVLPFIKLLLLLFCCCCWRCCCCCFCYCCHSIYGCPRSTTEPRVFGACPVTPFRVASLSTTSSCALSPTTSSRTHSPLIPIEGILHLHLPMSLRHYHTSLWE